MSIHHATRPATPDAAFALLRESVQDFKAQAGKTLDALKANPPTVDHYDRDSGALTVAVRAHSVLELAITNLSATYSEAALLDATTAAAMLGRKGAITFACEKSAKARELTGVLEAITRDASPHLATAAVDAVDAITAAALCEAVDANTAAVHNYDLTTRGMQALAAIKQWLPGGDGSVALEAATLEAQFADLSTSIPGEIRHLPDPHVFVRRLEGVVEELEQVAIVAELLAGGEEVLRQAEESGVVDKARANLLIERFADKGSDPLVAQLLGNLSRLANTAP